jgi:hypothetical protein
MNGASGSVAFNANDWFGVASDFGVYHDYPSESLTGETYTVGPDFLTASWTRWRHLPRRCSADRTFGFVRRHHRPRLISFYASVSTGSPPTAVRQIFTPYFGYQSSSRTSMPVPSSPF